jgi:outer membrane murein-binding lipoprotein Lpp
MDVVGFIVSIGVGFFAGVFTEARYGAKISATLNDLHAKIDALKADLRK